VTGSLRKKLIIHTTLAMLAVFTAASIALCAGIRKSLETGFDHDLMGKAQSLAWLVEIDGKKIKMEVDAAQVEKAMKDEMFVLLDASGKRHSGTSKMSDEMLERFKQIAGGESQSGPIEFAEEHWRFAALRFQVRLEDEKEKPSAVRPWMMMIVARRSDSLAHQVNELGWITGGVVALALLLSAGVIAWVVGRGLRPLGALAKRIDSIGDEDLSARVDVEGSPTELRPVVDRLNELLVRLEGAFAREKNFTADIAHELRTPLAGLTTALEVAASHQRSPQEYEHVVNRCLKVSRTMRLMVENLLMLARVDARQVRASGDTLEISPLLSDAWKDFAPLAERRGLEVAWNCANSLAVASDRGLLMVVFRNLFDNAVHYAGEDGYIKIAAGLCEQKAVISVANSGSQVEAEDAEKVFDRFWRGDAARTSAGEHCGLGLALCKRIMSVLGGSITVSTQRGGEFRITIKLPAEGENASRHETPQDEALAETVA
jgi:heavy metal sensor kinase